MDIQRRCICFLVTPTQRHHGHESSFVSERIPEEFKCNSRMLGVEVGEHP